jgi:hypothetical protein
MGFRNVTELHGKLSNDILDSMYAVTQAQQVSHPVRNAIKPGVARRDRAGDVKVSSTPVTCFLANSQGIHDALDVVLQFDNRNAIRSCCDIVGT